MHPLPPLLNETLRTVARRYRVPAIGHLPAAAQATNTTATLAIVIEQTRAAIVRGEAPDAALGRRFTDALATLIHEAMRTEGGDPAFQALLLKHRSPQVREYVSLASNEDHDGRRIRTIVDAIAHPAKLQRAPPGPQREALGQLHTEASSAAWSDLENTVRRVLDMADATPLEPALRRLLDSPELARLQRLDTLASNAVVRQYRALWDQHGPRSGSAAAAVQGSTAQRRGAAVEAAAAQALEALARRLNEAENVHTYRVMTSMRVPSSIPGSADRAKSEWDAVLLRQAETADDTWDVCLLVEVKASVDAATTDLPRLLRGLRLLGNAEKDTTYSFATREGEIRLRGASLAALSTDEADLPHEVLYCCDASAEPAPRLLSAASRMQLLSAEASLAFAGRLTDDEPVSSSELESVWQDLLRLPHWAGVLNQYEVLRSVRKLMVHVEDLSAAIEARLVHGPRGRALP